MKTKRLTLPFVLLSVCAILFASSAKADPTSTPTPCSVPVAVFNQNFDGVTPPTLPSGWLAANAIDPDAILWASSNSGMPLPVSDSAPNAAAVNDPAMVSDKRLDSPIIPISNPFAQLTFRNNYRLESTFDGGVLEVSVGGGAFTDIIAAGGSFATGGYNATISTSFGSPIAGRAAWSGNSGGFTTTTVNLPAAAAGQNVKLRWRMASDTSVAIQGWRIDGIVVSDCPPPGPTPTPQPITVTLPTATFDNSVPIAAVINLPVATTYIAPSLNYVGFQGDFTYDSAVVSFSSPLVQGAGLTASNWNLALQILPGPGTMKTARLSAVSADFTPLNGSGTLFNLRMVRVSSTPGTTSPLVWKPNPNNFIFEDADLNTQEPGSTPSGLITITGTGPTATPTPITTPTATPTPSSTPPPTATPSTPGPITVTLPTASFDNSVPIATVIIVPVSTTYIDPGLNYIGFQGDFTYDSAVVSFSSPLVQGAGLTAGNWNLALQILPGPGTMKTARLSAVSVIFTPLNGSGTLFNLRMVRVSSTPGTTSPLVWKPNPDNFIFLDPDLDPHEPASTPSGLITITGTGPTATPTPITTPTATPTPSPPPPPTATPSTPGPITVTLPTATFDNSVPIATIIIVPVITTYIAPSLNYVGFQGDFTYDSTVVSFSSPFVQGAGLTASNWNIALNLLPGTGPIKTARLSAFSNDFTPLNGSGTLFNLRMVRVSSTPGATSPLVWKPDPDNFIFVDADLNTHAPASTPGGLITITGTGPTATPTATPIPINISGLISYCSNPSPGPVQNVTLTLSGSASGSTLSDGAGSYQFSSLGGGGSYTVTPTKNAVAPGSSSINTVDVVAVQRHFLQIAPLSGCRLKAADVNGDNTVNTVDGIAIRQFFFGHPSANVGKYQFTPASRTYPAVGSNQTGQNYDVLIFGDVAPSFADRPDGPSQDEAGDDSSAGETLPTVALPEVAADRSRPQ